MATTVFTSTLTALVADRPDAATVRRLLSVAAMFTGAFAGGWLQLRYGTPSRSRPCRRCSSPSR